MAEDPQSWWQTAAGLMTGAATLFTAVMGVVIGLHQIRKDSEEAKRVAAVQSSATHSSSSADGPPLRSAVPRRSESTPKSSSKADVRTVLNTEQPRTVDTSVRRAPTIDRPDCSVPLPAKHEFVLGAGLQTRRFILTGIQLAPHTAESDILKVSVEVLADGQQQFPFNSSQFELRLDE